MKNDLISIIVPVYNISQYLRKCIDSIISQSYDNIEVLLIDDASTDNSLKICDFYQNIDERIRLFHFQKNKGLSVARNKGIEEARGKFLAFVDGDDWIHSDYIYCLHKALIETGCKVAMCGSEMVFDEIDMESCRIFSAETDIYGYKAYFKFLYSILERDCITVWNKLYDSSLFRDIRFPEGRIHEDEFVTYRVVYEASRVAVIYSKLYYYRRRRDSITGTFSLNRIDAHLALCERKKFFRDRKEEDLLNWTEQIHYKWLSDMAPEFGKHGYKEIEEELQEQKNLYEKKVQIKKQMFYLFPFSKIPCGSRIILYGAGNMGTNFFQQIVKTSYCQLTGWVDQNAFILKQKGYPIKMVSEIKKWEGKWDYVIIAIANQEIVFEVIDYLRSEFAIPDSKIIRFVEIIT